MPAWMLAALVKYVLPLVLSELLKTHAATHAEALAVKLGMNTYVDIKGLKKFSAPTDFPNPPPQDVAQGQQNSNINKG